MRARVRVRVLVMGITVATVIATMLVFPDEA